MGCIVATEGDNRFAKFLNRLGLREGMHVMMHSAYRSLRTTFPGISIDGIIDTIQSIIGTEGSLLMPTFTYCFKKSSGEYTAYDRNTTPGKVGAIPDVFRKRPQVVRTASPTHSFALWGKISAEIDAGNNPQSPLGKGSVMEWLDRTDNTHIMMLGTNFRSLSFAHYLEIISGLPWADFSPWESIGVLPYGVSPEVEFPLIEIPGCSKPFIQFEEFLLANGLILGEEKNGLHAYLLPVDLLHKEGLTYFKTFPDQLLCPQGTCQPCDARWVYYLEQVNNSFDN